MSCPELVPIPSSQAPVDASSCLAGTSPEDYGLANYEIELTSTVAGNIVTTTVVFLGGPMYTVIFTYNRIAQTITADRGTLPANAAAGRYTLNDDLPVTAWVFFFPRPGVNTSPIQFLFDYFSSPGQIKVYARKQEQFSFSLPTPDSIPNITASIIPTPDGKDINELIFTVTDFLPCGGTQTRSYRQPVVRFAPVICGCASSLQQKILDLGEGETFLQYLVLRYILSGITRCFDVNLLRQRYNRAFLASLEGTQYDVFLPILQANPEFPSYFLC